MLEIQTTFTKFGNTYWIRFFVDKSLNESDINKIKLSKINIAKKIVNNYYL